ncbi:MAG TPA: 1-acyl-sn-glycerol-3-phosphate acyltransferase [Puia sp.]|nr:1-acyl-sn-glycerol-3-phosphate acyltransferase [Puia sp.]
MRTFLKPLQWLYCLWAFSLFILSTLLVVPFVAVFSLSRSKGGNLIYRVCHFWADSWFFLIGIRHQTLPASRPDPAKQYIYIANHISYLDIPSILKTIRHSHFRVLGKAEMRRVPFFGYIYRRTVIMVDRSSSDQRSKSVRELKSVLKQGMSVFIYPEGTFNETHHALKEFYDGAFRLAIETRTPIKPILFLDTYDRMHYKSIFSLNPGRSRAVFLPEQSVEGLSMQDLPSLRSMVYRLMEARLKEYRASWID